MTDKEAEEEAKEAARDALVDAEVERALEPYRGLFAREDLEEMRSMLRIFARTHPTPHRLIEQLVTRQAPDESGKQDVRAFRGAGPGRRKAEGEG